MDRVTLRNIINEIKEESLEERDMLVYLLHRVQDHYQSHYIPPEVGEMIAEELNIPSSKVYEVLTFYTMFSTKPRGKYIIRVCTSLPCHVPGGREIVQFLKQKLGVDFGETTKDGLFTLEETGCLGLCGVSPVIMVNDQYYGDLTVEKVNEIIENLKGGEGK
ncbi:MULTISPECIES: NADH-quinone oxidoreductase subunit NuoE [Fervidobacterium]|uniref:NADH-quinone oxidoreductase, E subunit n=1 Tax=Fervidobacterium nodosum (strain ATCC 35602 / DSM 5306 / Rt17-B1) TaxID=381764 RepID=A7HLQ9_FERNB|nr:MULTISPECIES: NADH-quinone oxidoreductase subunit NuoE [Fervidobacterium]ABS60842.1 NADH-quinone oxidoreductase, E subunit [Fervidobacterium nodosum Rt17-B1]PHJ14000.1 NADH-quinone oxidoreductase subunit E [Fervidobacterium sp. SC_NGM5_G05]HOJ94164.1 NADH-quinone oxidoreductase subunit NuoE [Fervidobacterium nodosum]